MITYYTSAYAYLREQGVIGDKNGEIKLTPFGDGERELKFLTSPNGQDVVIVGGTINDAATMELYDLACAAVKYGAKRLTLVIPYFGYSTQERAVDGIEAISQTDSKKGLVVVGAKTRARLLSSIPHAPLGNRIVMFDLHAEGLPYYFEDDVLTFHLYGKAIVLRAARDFAKNMDFVFGSTDAGRAKWILSLAKDAGVQPAFVYKRHTDDRGGTEVYDSNCDVKGKTVVIYDDMVRSGGSAWKAAKTYRDRGATKVFLIASHGVLPEGSIRAIYESGYIDGVALTDSHPGAFAAQREMGNHGSYVRVYSMLEELNKLLAHLA